MMHGQKNIKLQNLVHEYWKEYSYMFRLL